MGISDGRNDVAGVVQSAESTRDVRTLSFLYLIEQLTYISRHGTHAESVQRAIQHVRLYACLMERLRPLAHSFIRVLSKQKIYLFKTSAIGLYTCKTTHLNDGGSHFHQLVDAGYVFSGTLPHVPEYQTELNFSFHAK